MTASNNLPSRIGGAVLIAAAIGLTAGPAPASAAPPPSGALLFIEEDPNNLERWSVQVQGMFPMGEYESHGFINNINTGKNPGGTLIQLYGDTDGEELYERFYPGAGRDPKGSLFAGAEGKGIRYLRMITVPKSLLVEGDGFGGVNSRHFISDPIYARAKFIDANGEVRGDQSSGIVVATSAGIR
jgi:hypothetical protein